MWAQRLFARARTASTRLPSTSLFSITRTKVAFAGGLLAGAPVLTGEEFFEHSFVTNKSPDDIVDFYSTEDFLQILGVFPFAIHFVLSGVEWDLERENTMKVHNSMEISFSLEEREEETEDGEKVVAFFQKRERFKNYIPLTRFLLWDQTQRYGYTRRDDGSCEVTHRGESFYGPFPVRLLVQLHAKYVIWATQRHINSPAFGNGDLEVQERQRSNVPLHAFRDFLRRLALAQKVALESGKIAAGAETSDAEETLRRLRRLQQSPTEAYVSTLRSVQRGERLRRHATRVEVGNAEDQAAIDGAIAALAKTKQGQADTAAALDSLVRTVPEVIEMEPRYGGSYRGRELRRSWSASSA